MKQCDNRKVESFEKTAKNMEQNLVLKSRGEKKKKH